MINRRHPAIASILRARHPNYSCCEKCGLPWCYCKPKTVMWRTYTGTFATCDVCWSTSTLPELKRYFTSVYIKQTRQATLDHTLAHLLDCVEKEYYKEEV